MKPRRPKRWRRRISHLSIALLVLLVALRAVLPLGIQRYVNRTLDRIPSYDGHVGDIDLWLIRGAYTIKDLKLIKTTGKVPVPLLSADSVDFSIQWRALLEGKVVGEIAAERAVLNFVNGPTQAQTQTEVDSVWLQAVKDLFPLRINRFELKDSEIHYRDFSSNPQVDVFINDVHLLGTNFSNTSKPTDSLEARIQGQGLAEGQSPVKVNVKLNPASKTPTFTLDGDLQKVKLAQLNSMLRAYGGFDAEAGTFELYTEMQAENNRIRGYLKPFFKDVEVVSWKQDSDSVVGLLWDSVVATLFELFKNQSKDQIATKVPFEGKFGEPKTEWLPTIGGILKNAFIRSLKPGIDRKLDLQPANVEKPGGAAQ